MRASLRVTGPAALVLLLATAACADDDGVDDSAVVLDVLAASSLTGVFEQLAEDFEAAHEGVEVRLSLGSSTTLAQQVVEGAPADVLATADQASMDVAAGADAVADPVQFATNEMVLVTPADDPAGIGAVTDLVRGGVRYVTCVPEAPCGALATRLLDENGVGAEPVSLEPDVKAVVAKVGTGEVDAGLVYATDARAAGDDLRSLPVPGSADALNPYLVAAVAEADDADLAAEWVDLVTGPEGVAVLEAAGFGPAGG